MRYRPLRGPTELPAIAPVQGPGQPLQFQTIRLLNRLGNRILSKRHLAYGRRENLGMGMGPSISLSIVEPRGGSLRMSRSVRSGAILIFDLPTAETQASTDAG
jgi:signal transduction histidine kinase